MFTKDSLVSMSNGLKKNINLIRPGEYILNKFKHPAKVNRIHIVKEQLVAEIELDNGTPPFFAVPETRVFSHFTSSEGIHSTSYCTLEYAYEKNGTLKKSIRSFSPESDVIIVSYHESDILQDVYCLHTADTSQSFIVNNIIVCCESN